jgi:hypothetical protein
MVAVTFDLFFNLLLVLASLIWLLLLPVTVGRIMQKRSRRTMTEVVCISTTTVLWLLSVLFTYLRHGSLNSEPVQSLFLAGMLTTWLPGLIVWTKRRFVKATAPTEVQTGGVWPPPPSAPNPPV